MCYPTPGRFSASLELVSSGLRRFSFKEVCLRAISFVSDRKRMGASDYSESQAVIASFTPGFADNVVALASLVKGSGSGAARLGVGSCALASPPREIGDSPRPDNKRFAASSCSLL